MGIICFRSLEPLLSAITPRVLFLDALAPRVTLDAHSNVLPKPQCSVMVFA